MHSCFIFVIFSGVFTVAIFHVIFGFIFQIIQIILLPKMKPKMFTVNNPLKSLKQK